MSRPHLTYVNRDDHPNRRTTISFATKEQYDAEIERLKALPPAEEGTANTLIGYINTNGEYVER